MSVFKANTQSFNNYDSKQLKNRSINVKNIFTRSIVLICALLLVTGCSSNKKKDSIEDLAQQQVEELYGKAKSALDRGNYAFAIRYYQALESNFPYGEYTEQAKLDLLFAYDKTGQIDKGIEAADNFITLYPTHKNVDYAYYMKGVASFEKKIGRLDRFMKGGRKTIRDPQPYRDSDAAFNELIKRYPQSTYAEDAKQRIVYINNALAERELAIANFYYDSNAHLAAVNRCKTIIYQYETTPAVEGALVLMEKSYLEMGLNDLAASTHKVLVENFPNYSEEPLKVRKKSFLSRLNPFQSE